MNPRLGTRPHPNPLPNPLPEGEGTCRRRDFARSLLIAAAVIVAACGQPVSAPERQQAAGERPGREAAQPRGSITIAWASLPDHLVNKFSNTPAGTAARWI